MICPLYAVGLGAYLLGMTSLHPTPASAAESPAAPEPVVAVSFGARLAATSRRRQGIPEGVTDLRMRERLRALCSLPRPPRSVSRVPDEFDPASE